MTALTVDPLGRKMRPRCGHPIRNGIYWGDQVCGRPAGHGRRHLSVEAYRRYLIHQREVNAARYARQRDQILQARRHRYVWDVLLARVRHQLDGQWPVVPS